MRTGNENDLAARRWLFGVLLVGGVYLGVNLLRQWFPHDEGALAQAAERVLHGEVPHRNFDDPYTGLLAYVHALAFALGGIRLTTLRIPLLVGTLFWMAAYFRIVVRLIAAPGAAAVTLVALFWSVPNYPASLPSWYNLFCATFGILALLKWRESDQRRWLVLAGFAGGISFLFKLSGLFLVAGELIFLVYATASRNPPCRAHDSSERTARSLVTIALIIFLLVFVGSFRPLYSARIILHLILPVIALVLALILREWSPAEIAGSARLRALVQATVPLVLGAALPILTFAGAFLLAGGFDELIRGVFVAPFRRFTRATLEPPRLFAFLVALPLVMLLRPLPGVTRQAARRWGFILAGLLALLLWDCSRRSLPYRMVWESVRGLFPLVSLAVAYTIAWPRFVASWRVGCHEQLVLFTAVTAFASLVQFPFSAPVYFLYVAPLVLLVIVAFVEAAGAAPWPIRPLLLTFFGAFVVFLVTSGKVINMGWRYWPNYKTVLLDLPRAGLRISPEDADLYGTLIPRLQSLAKGRAVWAGPDVPEVYFLAGFRNPTRSIFDFLGGSDDSTNMLLDVLDGNRVGLVVINHAPPFSGRLPDALVKELRVRYPKGETLMHLEYRWQE